MALLLGRHYEFPQCGILKEKLLLLLLDPDFALKKMPVMQP
jgi:hypothetical protein